MRRIIRLYELFDIRTIDMRRWVSHLIAPAALMIGAAGAPAAAQQPTAGQSAVVGVVFDSLAGRPLGGAIVTLSAAGQRTGDAPHRFRTRTAASGAFAFSGVTQGTYQLAVVHPFLDSLGMGALAKDVAVGDSGTVEVHVATPSLATLDHGRCAASDVLVAAFVRDAATRGPLPESEVRLSWLEATHDASGVQVERPTVVARADSLGAVYTCVPPRANVVAVAQSGAYATDPVPVRVSDDAGTRHPVSILDLYIDRAREDSLHAGGQRDARHRTGTATLVGYVRKNVIGAPPNVAKPSTDGAAVTIATDSGPRAEPIGGVRVMLLGVDRQVKTDRSGRFVLADLPAGSEGLTLSRPGYVSALRAVALHPGDTTRLTVVLTDSISIIPFAGRSVASFVKDASADGGTAMTVTDHDGHYRLDAPARDTFVVTLRRIGYEPEIVRIDLAGRSAVQWDTTMTALPQTLTAMKTTARLAPDALSRSGFYDRMLMRQKGVGTGVFITQQEIEQRHTPSILYLMDKAPGVFMNPKTRQVMGPSMEGGYCVMEVYLDGQRVGQPIEHAGHGSNPVALLDGMASPLAVAGIEIYSDPVQVPGEYQLLNGMCGVILIWTK